jgi:hypothetical protein
MKILLQDGRILCWRHAGDSVPNQAVRAELIGTKLGAK